MRTNRITLEHNSWDYGTQTRLVDTAGSAFAPGKQVISVKADPGAGVNVSGTPTTLGRLQALNARLNAVAKSIGHSDSVMRKIGGLLEEMEKRLDAAAKSYPPFPPGSEERVKYLESYTGLRAQIDQLTIPPREDDTRRVLEDSNGLDIPDLPKDASDEQIRGALEKIGDSKETVEIERGKLAEGLEKLKRQSEFKLAWKKIHPSYGEEMRAAEDEEFLADRASADVKDSLSTQWGSTLTATQTALAQSLG